MPEIAALFPGAGWWLMGLLGACFGSFANLVIHRLPLGVSIWGGRSRCPSCKKPLEFSSLIPIFSWIFLRGKCAKCHKKISPRYLVVELISTGIFLAAYAAYGASLATIFVAFAGLVLLMMAAIDLEHYILPDTLQIILAVLGVCFGAATGASFTEQGLMMITLLALAISLRLFMQAWKKREALGYGDVKLFAVSGIFLPHLLLAPFLFLAGIAGVLLAFICRRGEGGIFPFGPALAFSLLTCLILPEALFNNFQYLIDFLVELSLHSFDK